MADYTDVRFDEFTFTLREAQYAKPNERGMWRYANCTRCGVRFDIRRDESAVELLHRLHEHSCAVHPSQLRSTEQLGVPR
jgi:hypothetical protein